jgi:SAM-dependent MidA family methyltransferase
MARALYGDNGFYVAPDVPAGGFRTSAHASAQWGAIIHALATRVEDSLVSPERFAIVDVGAGGGELLTALADLSPPRWSLCGVDVAPRPARLPSRVTWSKQPPEMVTGLLMATELLDVVPLDVAELTTGGPRVVEVSPTGDEQLGDIITGRDARWLAAWWPPAGIGDRAEIGWPRDDVWQSLTARLDRGVALAVDYAANPARDLAGTMTGYRAGRQVQPVPDGTCDITAHVLFESLAQPTDIVMSQHDALRALGVRPARPAYDGDAATYLAALSAAGEAAELLDESGLGGFSWLLHAVGVPQPLDG